MERFGKLEEFGKFEYLVIGNRKPQTENRKRPRAKSEQPIANSY